MLELLAAALVAAGMAILGWSVVLNCRLIKSLPEGSLRSHWRAMNLLVGAFIVGYAAYLAIFVSSHSDVTGLVVPVVFFFGAGYVWLTARLGLETAEGVRRIAALEQETVTDPLTGLFNRRYLDRRLEEEVARASRYETPLSVLVLDLDYFKDINDRFGHQGGDIVLRMFAEVVEGALRETDFVARYGGEEFVVVAPHTELADAESLAERLRKRIETEPLVLPPEHNLRKPIALTASIGVASRSTQLSEAKAIVQAADRCLYRAKRLGRNRVVADEVPVTRKVIAGLQAGSAA